MLKNYDIIVLSDDWGLHPFSCQHIIKKMLPWNRILWINTIGYRSIKFTKYDIRRTVFKIKSWFGYMATDSVSNIEFDNLTIISSTCLPFAKVPGVRKFNRWSIVKTVKKNLKKLRFRNYLLITTLPTVSDFLEMINPRFSIYYCVDDFTLWPGVYGNLIRELEERLLSQVDLVIATSDNLMNTRKGNKNETKLLTHGVDRMHFSGKDQNKMDKRINKVIGYFGLVDERCDMELLTSIVRELNNFKFTLIGERRVPTRNLRGMKNVNLLGKVSYDILPQYLKDIDVFILPYKINELTKSINPLKLKEYLSTGKPVIATPIPEVLKLSKYLTIASTSDEFKKAILEIDQNEYATDPNLSAFLSEESWDSKAEEFSEYVLTAINP